MVGKSFVVIAYSYSKKAFKSQTEHAQFPRDIYEQLVPASIKNANVITRVGGPGKHNKKPIRPSIIFAGILAFPQFNTHCYIPDLSISPRATLSPGNP